MQGNEKRKENEDDYCIIMLQASEKPRSEEGDKNKKASRLADLLRMVARVGIEPTTREFSVRCSTN